MYEYNVMFLYYMLNNEIINWSHVQSFFETLPKIFMWKLNSNITNKSASFERGVDLKLKVQNVIYIDNVIKKK